MKPMEFSDDYEHKIEGILYFPRSFPTKEAEHLFEYDLTGCDCIIECKSNSCSCVKQSGTSYSYEHIKGIENYIILNKNVETPTYECNNNCECKNEFCGNRLVQFGPRKGLEVKLCENRSKGFGLFTMKDIKAGNFVCEYAGEIITEDDAKQRFKIFKEQGKMNYIFCINEMFGPRKQRTYIDPTYYGNIGRYINHSCDPNCQLAVIRENDTTPILSIFAKNDIKENTEITYDYGDGNINAETEERRKTCYCNSINCRKYLPFDPGLS